MRKTGFVDCVGVGVGVFVWVCMCGCDGAHLCVCVWVCDVAQFVGVFVRVFY